MPRALFEKTGNAVWISHLDLMRVFQRAFKRAGLPLTHTQGFNPRPSVSIALPMSVGMESGCELLDFDLEGEKLPCDEIMTRLNAALIPDVRVLAVYEGGQTIGHLAYLDCVLTLEYDRGVEDSCVPELRELFSRDSLIVEKKNKNGVSHQDIIPMIKKISIQAEDAHTVTIRALVCCQNPTLNPMQMALAIEKNLPHRKPDFVRVTREEIYDEKETVFR